MMDPVAETVSYLRGRVDDAAFARERSTLGDWGRTQLRLAKARAELVRDTDVIARAFGLKLGEL